MARWRLPLLWLALLRFPERRLEGQRSEKVEMREMR
jgi:hypothetical protein